MGLERRQPVMHGSDAPTSARPWYAIRTRTGCEFSVAEMLRSKQYSVFLPSHSKSRQYSDRTKLVELALFPGYLFCELGPGAAALIITTPGVLSIVSRGKTPIEVDAQEIAALRMMVTRERAKPWPFVREGQLVLLHSGPLRGLQGYIVRVKDEARLVVSVTLLQRSAAVEIDGDWATPVCPAAAAASAGKS